MNMGSQVLGLDLFLVLQNPGFLFFVFLVAVQLLYFISNMMKERLTENKKCAAEIPD